MLQMNSTPIHHLQCRLFSGNKNLLNCGILSARVLYPWENDSIAQKCVMKLTGVPPHVVQLAAIEQIKTIVSEIQPGVLEGVEKMLDDRTMGGTLSETRMKSILEESRKEFVEELADQRMPTTANNMPWSATGNGTDHTELMDRSYRIDG